MEQIKNEISDIISEVEKKQDLEVAKTLKMMLLYDAGMRSHFNGREIKAKVYNGVKTGDELPQYTVIDGKLMYLVVENE